MEIRPEVQRMIDEVITEENSYCSKGYWGWYEFTFKKCGVKMEIWLKDYKRKNEKDEIMHIYVKPSFFKTSKSFWAWPEEQKLILEKARAIFKQHLEKQDKKFRAKQQKIADELDNALTCFKWFKK